MRTKAMQRYMDDHPYCEVCGRVATDCHHIARRNLPDTDDPENFLALCYQHHISEYHGKGWHWFCRKYPHLQHKIEMARLAHNLKTSGPRE
jgi:hypothetical protein